MNPAVPSTKMNFRTAHMIFVEVFIVVIRPGGGERMGTNGGVLLRVAFLDGVPVPAFELAPAGEHPSSDEWRRCAVDGQK